MSSGAVVRDDVEISIVVPTYNDGAFLTEALASIRAQEVDCAEVIVVDDGSDDPVEEAVHAVLPGARVLRQTNAGPSAARNAGIRVARGAFVAFLDGDDLWTDGALQRLRRGFENAPRAAVVQGHLRRFECDPRGARTRYGPVYRSFNVGALVCRRDALMAAGLFDESLRRSEDVDLFMRLQDIGAPRLVIPDPVLLYRRTDLGGDSKARRHALDRGTRDSWISLLRASLERRRAAAPVDAFAAQEPEHGGGISVIIAVRDGMRYLPGGLASVRRQTLPPTEIVAVVGASEDGTLEYLREQPDVHVVEQPDEGLARARNLALDAVTQPWVAFFDHDDLWHPDKLAKQVAALELFDRPGACIVNFLSCDGRESIDIATSARPDRLPVLGWTPSALLAHREVFTRVGDFDPDLGMGCDADWFARLRRLRIPCTVAGRVLLWKRRHSDNLSRDPAHTRARMFQVIRKARLEGRE